MANDLQEGEALWVCDMPSERGAWIDVDLFQATPDGKPPPLNRSINYHITKDIPNEGYYSHHRNLVR
ncbi:MAG: hypothetical protein GFH25_541186n380 [Chloroflexi bacterium AL-N10]|nr:hypothetical protein [Chloroflexi bacterium AL-N1]NOK66694.1 hypothetical protein [Chloroflexi bacterium AL-N10]NOK72082.1 hypothetical protein [Chloroflexi bacterium AL-N5]